MHPIKALIKERMVFGAWCVFNEEVADPERCKRVAESGIDFGYIDLKRDHSNTRQILDNCEKAGLLALVFDPNLQGIYADHTYRIPQMIESYKDHPALAGFGLRDEPGIDDFPRLRKMTDECLKAAPDKMPAINLYPYGCDDDQLGHVSYEEYINKYVNELAVDTISYDRYPLYGQGDKTWIIDDYLRNFEIVARACKKSDCDMWYFIQTLCFNTIRRDPVEEDIRWQIFCAMSFGAKVIQLFTYGTPGNGVETFEDSMIDRQGNKTHRYDFIQKVIREMNAITGNYVPYQWEGVMTTRNGLNTEERFVDVIFPGHKTRTVKYRGTYMDVDHPLDKFEPIVSFGGELPLLMGCFTRGEKKAFTLVNMEDPGKKLDNKACVVFEGPGILMVHGKDGSRKVETDGKWDVTLGWGEGIFVEIL